MVFFFMSCFSFIMLDFFELSPRHDSIWVMVDDIGDIGQPQCQIVTPLLEITYDI
jgi:hypothetical protein